jgi:hypothetical protein
MDEQTPAGFALAGAIVRRPLTSGVDKLPIGHVMAAERFLAIGIAHRRALLRNEMLVPFYTRTGEPAPAPTLVTRGRRKH